MVVQQSRQWQLFNTPIDIPELITILQTRHADTVYLDADPTPPYSSVVRLISVARTAGVQRIGLTTLSR
jgi:biopolymer transport protein ExbD